MIDLLGAENVKNLSPCGRLDIDTEGLLLLTDDGQLIHNLLSPKKHVHKVYEVHLKKELSDKDIEKLEKGVDIGDRNDDGSPALTRPSKVDKIASPSEDNIIHLTIYEGRFHQVKRMMEAVGNEVRYLKRLSMGSLVLDESLKPGEYRSLSCDEINDLKNSR